MRVADVVEALDRLAPLRLAEAWDNVGLLAGDPAAAVTRALACVDLTADVLDEAITTGCELVVAYHPPIFKPLQRVVAGGIVHDALRARIAIVSPHTALDSAPGGTNDVLAEALGLADRSPITFAPARARHVKLVTFVPVTSVDVVSSALFDAGAGVIGNYTSCSFRMRGTGTFFGQDGSQPSVGEAGRLEQVDEIRVETVAPMERMTAIIAALRASHPYEQPAFDLAVLEAPPEGTGQGRIGDLAAAVLRSDLIARIRERLALERVLVAGPRDGSVTCLAVAAGSGGELVDRAMDAGAELVVTGEVSHHRALEAARRGVTLVMTLHSNSERAGMRELTRRLAAELEGLAIDFSQRDRDPFDFA